jgi:hypothetical protein
MNRVLPTNFQWVLKKHPYNFNDTMEKSQNCHHLIIKIIKIIKYQFLGNKSYYFKLVNYLMRM